MLLIFEESNCDISKGFFVRSPNISVESWATALQSSTLVAKTLTECGGYCLYKDSMESNLCNAFQFVKESKECNLANVTFLEDTREGIENIVRTYFFNSSKLYMF